MKNEILEDLRKYRAERLTMNNPKGWAHILRIFDDAWRRGYWRINVEEYTFAHTVITRLAYQEERSELVKFLHSRYEFDWDECDHGTYTGGPSHGKPYAMCERQADALLAEGYRKENS